MHKIANQLQNISHYDYGELWMTAPLCYTIEEQNYSLYYREGIFLIISGFKNSFFGV